MATNPISTDRLLLSNDAVGTTAMDNYAVSYLDALLFDTSAHGVSASAIQAWIGPMMNNGHIVDFFLGVARPAISASGFISGTVDAAVYINSAQVLSTNPSIPMLAASAGLYAGYNTRGVLASALWSGTSAVVNNASSFFSAGDFIAATWNARSVG